MPAVAGNLEHPRWDVRASAQRLLTALAPQGAFHPALAQAGITFQTLGFPEGVDGDVLSRFGLVWSRIQGESGYQDLSLGGRAALRWKLLLAARRLKSVDLENLGQTWLTHLLRLEALDQTVGLPTVGAEIHTDSSNVREIEMAPVVLNLASGVGPHAMNPVHPEGKSLLDFRLLPGYPSTFSLLLHQFLGASRVKGIPAVGAHYSVGVDLRENLVPLSLALFYGDPRHAWPPKAREEADQGFPGVDTYRGQTINVQGGEVMQEVTQSNLHLRPLKIVRDRGLGLEPEALFPMDLEAVAWLSMGAMAPKGSMAADVFEAFLQDWEKWVKDLGGEVLAQQVYTAQHAIVQQSGAILSDALDQASAGIYEKLHGLSSEEAWEKMSSGDPAVKQFQRRGLAKRNELALLLNRTLGQLQEAVFVDHETMKALQAYRAGMIQGDDLEELDSLYAAAVQALSRAIFNADRGSEQEARLLKLLEGWAPEQAGKIREALNKPSAAGLEEKEGAPPVDWLIPQERADVFAGLSSLMEQFRQQPELEFEVAAPSTAGIVVDLSASVEETIAVLYLPEGLTVLVNPDALLKAEQLTGRTAFERGLHVFYVENNRDFVQQVNRAIGSFQGVDSVQIFSTRQADWIKTAVDVGGRDIPVYVHGNLTLEELLANVGAIWSEVLKHFLDLVHQSTDYSRYL